MGFRYVEDVKRINETIDFAEAQANPKDWYPPFQRKQAVKTEVSDYNSKPGKLPL